MDLPKRLKKGSSYGFRFKSDPLNNRPWDSQSSQSIVVQDSLKHPIKSHNFNLAFN